MRQVSARAALWRSFGHGSAPAEVGSGYIGARGFAWESRQMEIGRHPHKTDAPGMVAMHGM